MPAPKTEERKLAMEWFATPTAERWEKGFPLNDKEMRAKLGVKTTVWNKWINQFHEKQKRDVVMKCHPMATGGEKSIEVEVIEPDYASDAYLNDKTEVVDKALISACEDNNAQALKIFYTLNKRLVERTEVKVGLTADELTRRNLEAERQLREGGYRVEEVPKKPALLPK